MYQVISTEGIVVGVSANPIAYDPLHQGWQIGGAIVRDAAQAFTLWRTNLTRIEFLQQFTAAERIAIRAAQTAGADADQLLLAAEISDWFTLMNDPSLQFVDLADPNVAGGVAALADAELIDPSRPAEILAALPAS